MNLKQLITFCSFASLLAMHALSQAPNLKWGKPSKEELTMTACAIDHEAKAVVLYSRTSVRYDFQQGDFKIVKNVRKRIKVLGEEGKNWANGNITTISLSNGRKETVTRLEATAYNLDGDKVVKTKMPSDLRDVAKVDEQRYVTKFTVPQVTVGTVIEYEYETLSDVNTYIEDWVAQDIIPVLYTTYETVIPDVFIYRLDETGMNVLQHKRETVPMHYTIDRDNYLDVNATVETFTGLNLPALHDYQFLYSIWTYAQRVSVEITAFQPPEGIRQNLAMTWHSVDETLLDAEYFGKRLGSNPLANEMRDTGIYDISSREQKIDAICKLLQSRVKWNRVYSTQARPLRAVVAQGQGNSADINLLLINMLNDAGVQAFPLVMRARNHGILTVTRPSMQQLTTVVAAVRHDDGMSYDVIDAAHQGGYVNVLDPTLLCDRARIISREQGDKWLDLSRLTIDKQFQTTNFKLSSDGAIDATVLVKMQGGAAMNLRHGMLQYADSAAFAAELAASLDGKVTNLHCDGMNDFSPTVSIKVHLERPGKATQADGIYINVVSGPMFALLSFTDETRTLPVELPYPINYEQVTNVWLPTDYEVEEIPKPCSMTSDDGSMRFSMETVLNEGVMSTQYKLRIDKTLFMPGEYATLKTFLDEVKSHRDASVLVKRKPK